MNRSALNAEVEYHLRRQERERQLAQPHHEVVEMEAKRAGLLSRLAARLRRNREQKSPLDWERAGRRVPNLK